MIIPHDKKKSSPPSDPPKTSKDQSSFSKIFALKFKVKISLKKNTAHKSSTINPTLA
jgi:hypothetical protein